jgi:hypothetical protein
MSNKEEIAKLLQKIADLEEADKQFQELSPAQQIATLLHAKECHSTDVRGGGNCSWHWESDPTYRGRGESCSVWARNEHTNYLNRAVSILSKLNWLAESIVVKVIEAL